MSYDDIPPGEWEFDLAFGSHWEQSSERCWVLITAEGYLAARVVGDMPSQLLRKVERGGSG